MLRFLRMIAAAGLGEEPEPPGGGEPAEENEYSVDKTGGGMFLLMCLAIGLLTRNVLAPKLPFPYTVSTIDFVQISCVGGERRSFHPNRKLFDPLPE
jgi:hypothetical protein